jgi:hypothetical protein
MAKSKQLDLTIRNIRGPLLRVELSNAQAQRLLTTGFEMDLPLANVVQMALDHFCIPAPPSRRPQRKRR